MKTKTNDYRKVDETILLVDDEKSILDLTCDMLNRNGYRAITAGSGEAAIEIYKRERDQIDLVLMDVEMPGMDGHRCFKALLRINPEIKVIIVTGYPADGKVKETIDVGAAGFMCKPYRSADMVKKVREVLDKR